MCFISLKLQLFMWFLLWFCKLEVLNTLPQIKQDFKRLNLCVFRFKMPYYVYIRSSLGNNKLVKLILSCFAYKICKTIWKITWKNLNCFERYDALFEIKNNFQILVLGTPEGYPALDLFNFIKVYSKFGIMTQSNAQTKYVYI